MSIRYTTRIKLFILLISGVIIISASSASSAEEGPLFIQVHYTNPVCSISREQLRGILEGRIGNFALLGGPDRKIHIYADSRISGRLAGMFPRLQCTPGTFGGDEHLPADRDFLGISDVRGLSPCFKALYVDMELPWGRMHDDYSLSDPGPYPFTAAWAEPWSHESAVIIVQTGVTAMTRAFIPAVDRAGDVLYPVKYTMTITGRADIASTSNEVSFFDPCTYPLKDRMTFCSPVRFFRILKESGFNVIELTGNHNNDFGCRCNGDTMDMLDRAEIGYFGGGRTHSEAERILYRKAKNTVFAFAGFNEIGPVNAWATDERPGALRLSETVFSRSVKEAVSKSDAALISVQWGNENDPAPQKIQRDYFHRAADLGAAVIVSSSAHRAMGIEFYRGRFISYGLGNFLFDQMQTVNHRRGLIARHHFYRGRHIQTELIPYLIHDHCQPRPVAGAGAREILEEVFRYSEGPVFR